MIIPIVILIIGLIVCFIDIEKCEYIVLGIMIIMLDIVWGFILYGLSDMKHIDYVLTKDQYKYTKFDSCVVFNFPPDVFVTSTDYAICNHPEKVKFYKTVHVNYYNHEWTSYHVEASTTTK